MDEFYVKVTVDSLEPDSDGDIYAHTVGLGGIYVKPGELIPVEQVFIRAEEPQLRGAVVEVDGVLWTRLVPVVHDTPWPWTSRQDTEKWEVLTEGASEVRVVFPGIEPAAGA